MAYNIIPQRGVFSTIANLINENFQRIYQQILGLDGSGEQAAEDISQLESDVSALQAGKANDADVVHKAGAETITGNKTFTGTVKLPMQNSGILVTDANGVVQSDSTALVNKVDKVLSTDNAVVRFDGASGDIQNSGVTINDSNHLTAAKLITSGGTAYDYVMGDGSLKDRYFQTLNTFSNQDSSKLYLEPVMDCMYAAHLKWNVSATITNTTTNAVTNVTDGQISGWFNGDYGRVGQYVGANETLKITIQVSDPENSYITTYSEGRLLLNFYNYGLPLSVSGRCYFGGSSSKAWANLTFTTQRGGRNGIYISSTLPTPFLRIIELTIVGQAVSGDPNKTNLSSIEMMRTRCGIGDYPIVTKYGIAQRMYGNLTAPKFITSGGTSSQFVKGDGSLDSTSYAPLASPALTGTPTAPTAASGTNTTQIATTAFVKSAIDDLSGTLTDGIPSTEGGNVIDVGGYDLMKIREIKGSSQVYEDTVVGNNVEKLDVYDTNDTKKSSLALNLSELTGTIGERLPTGYTKLEYIESTGTQYINTGISPTVNTGVEIKAVLTTENTTDKVLFGSRATTGNTRFWIDFDNTGSKHKILYGFGGYAEMVAYTLNTEYSIVFNRNGDKKVVINGTTYNVASNFDATNSIPIYLFRANYTSPIPGSFKVYYCRIFEGASLVRNLIPAKRNSDNAIGMYDKVSGTFFTNAGTGTFTAGSVVQDVTIFADGLHGVGGVYDSLIVDEDGYARRAVKRMGSVDLGSVNYSRNKISGGSSTYYYYTQLSPYGKYQGGLLSSRFVQTSSLAFVTYGENSRNMFLNNNYDLYLTHLDYNTLSSADFKTAMSGVMLYYELATPIEYVLDTPVQCVTKVYPNGTVKQVPVMPDSTPMVMDVTYLHDTGGLIGGLMNKLASLEAMIDDLMKGIKTISVQYGDATNVVLETEKINGNEGTVSIPAATSQAAGAMSAAQAALLEDLSDRVDALEG